MKHVSRIICTIFCIALSICCVAKGNAARIDDSSFIYPEYSKTISMEFKDALLKDVLKIFSQQSGLNFIAAGETANKTVTLYFENVPVESALERILEANDLTYEIQPATNIFIVKPIIRPETELITRVYFLKHATVDSSKLNDTISISDDCGGSSDSGSGGEDTSEDSEDSEDSSGIIAALKATLTTKGTLTEDARTNSLVITDIPTQFPVIEKTLARLDVPVPQVLIEVEMLDVSKAVADQIGIKYGATPLTFTGASRSNILIPWDENEMVREGKFTPADPEFTSGTVSAAGMTAALEFLSADTDTKYLARPRILTLNNETAQIRIVTDEAIGFSTDITSGDGLSSSSSTAERVETGVSLTVTPQVNLLANDITMAISPRVIEARTGGTYSGITFKDPEMRGTKSILRVRNGDTIMLGGLLRNEYSNTVTKLPVLGDLPVVGSVFRHKDKSDSERELIIFITPHIMEDNIVNALAFKRPTTQLIREQEISPERVKTINSALTAIENQRR